MTHPTHEDWMSFLYGEDSPERHGELETHLRHCAACSARMDSWRAGAKALDEWTLPAAIRVAARGTPWKWAAAAALVLGLGIAIGRLASPSGPDQAALRASLTREFDQKLAGARAAWIAELRQPQSETASRLLATTLETAGAETQRWLAGYARDQEDQRLSDREALVTTLRQFDAKYAASLALLRKELETVAVNTQDGFTETEQRLGQLASYKQPSDLPPK
jgi:hypothetical protein